MPTPREFVLAAGDLAAGQHAADLREVADGLQQRLKLHRDRDAKGTLTFLDTFDWRLHTAGFLLTRRPEALELSDRETGSLVIRAPAPEELAFGEDLPPALRMRLERVLGIRALLPVATVEAAEVVLAAHDADAKTVARLVVTDAWLVRDGDSRSLGRRATVLPLRGYAKWATALTRRVRDLPGVEPARSSLFEDALAASGRRPGDYSSKLSLSLAPETSTYDAARQIHRCLLATMRANEAGTVDDIDREFLHDFRVAVRRARSALKELPGALPVDVEQTFGEEFRWLGRVTTPTRDLDVYLLEFPSFSDAVGAAAGDLAPLHGFLRSEQRRAHSALRRALRSARYRRLQAQWGRVVDAEAPSAPAGPAGSVPIGETADARIRKVARRVLRDGAAIDSGSAAEALHDLRKRAKKLRYLLEFFASLYDRKRHAEVVSALRGLQDNLGAFQDSQVQRQAVEGFAEQLAATGSNPAASLLAIGRLVAVFDERQRHARAEFTERFAAFAAPENRRRLAELTGGDR